MTEREERILKQTIKAVEDSMTITEAAEKLQTSRQTVYMRLERNGLKIVKDNRLKVVATEVRL